MNIMGIQPLMAAMRA